MKKPKKIFSFIFLLFMAAGFLTACSLSNLPQEEKEIDTGFVAAQTGVYDSADTAVVADINLEEKTITLKNMEINRQYTLEYDGTTYFYDKYGSVISAAQLKKGEIVDVTFLKRGKRLNSLQLSDEAWSFENVSNYKLNEENFQAEVGSSVYNYSEDIVVISEGEQGDIIDINPIDCLTFRGIGSDVYSVVIEKGHGYVKLRGEEYFYGGWIEVGNRVIQKVTENMMLVVPEGEHQVIISNKGTSGTKQIQVRRNVEIELDVSDLKGKEPQYGQVLFTITPPEANLYLDGKKTDYSQPVKLEYGIHQMIVMATGYNTITQYLKVGQESAGIEVTMELRDDVSGNDISENDVSGNDILLKEVNKILEEYGYDTVDSLDYPNYESGSNPTTEVNGENTGTSPVTSALDYYITVDAPVEVEVYLDGNYIGISPCSFKKEAGSHTLTLRKTGYTAKSYTIQVDSEEKNVSYSFLDLVKIEE